MAKRKPTKAQSQRAHAKKRAWERYGIVLTQNDFQVIVRMIQNGEATLHEKQSNRVTLWKLLYKDTWIKVVYDKNRQTIASVLPMEDRSDADGNKEERSVAVVRHRN